MSPVQFVADNFSLNPKTRTVWLTKENQSIARLILGHTYRGLRVRYWQDGSKTGWIMDEIGKEKPITIGVVIDENKIQKITILEFRESRGGEVRHPFFTGQFMGLSLVEGNKLSQRIDGITGATLSVRAVSNVSRFALHLHHSLDLDETQELQRLTMTER
ncbi:MAG: FMN-binding protein [bacterium]|nr:FMN-binding protein [Gammaproteobacteria bacterium]HIL95547.1 FMN-binding protein [Pseudomonadales bacterium]